MCLGGPPAASPLGTQGRDTRFSDWFLEKLSSSAILAGAAARELPK